jgi:hypothetical protein
MALKSADIKRQILDESDKSGIRKRILSKVENNAPLEGEIIEMGYAFEKMVPTKGWLFVEQFMLKKISPVSWAFSGEDEDEKLRKGMIQAYVNLMQYVDQVIETKNILTKKEEADGKV